MRMAQISSLKKGYHWTRNASYNHISPDPVTFLTKVEIWDTLSYSPWIDLHWGAGISNHGTVTVTYFSRVHILWFYLCLK